MGLISTLCFAIALAATKIMIERELRQWGWIS